MALLMYLLLTPVEWVGTGESVPGLDEATNMQPMGWPSGFL